MKRIIALTVSIMLILSIISGCSTKEMTSREQTTAEKTSGAATEQTEAPEQVKLVIWGGVPEASGPQETAQNYSAVEPNVQVEYIRYVNDDQGNIKLDTALLAGENIDMFISYAPDKREKRVNAKVAADITDLCKKYDIDFERDFGDSAKDNINSEGKIFSVPTAKIAGFIMLNKKMFDDANIEIPKDWTWDDLREIAKKLSKGDGADKVYGFIRTPGGPFIESFLETRHNRDPWLNADATATVFKQNADFKKLYQLIFDMMYVDKTFMTWEDMIVQKAAVSEAPLFFNKNVAMVFSYSHQLRNIKDTQQFPRDFVVAFAPIPKVSKEQSKYYADIIAMDHISVNANSKHKEEAVKFIKWYYSEGFGPMIKGGRLPLYKEYDTDEVVKLMITEGSAGVLDEETFKSIVSGKYENMVSFGSNKGREEIAKIIQEETEGYFLNQNDLDKAIENLQTRCDDVLKNAK